MSFYGIFGRGCDDLRGFEEWKISGWRFLVFLSKNRVFEVLKIEEKFIISDYGMFILKK